MYFLIHFLTQRMQLLCCKQNQWHSVTNKCNHLQTANWRFLFFTCDFLVNMMSKAYMIKNKQIDYNTYRQCDLGSLNCQVHQGPMHSPQRSYRNEREIMSVKKNRRRQLRVQIETVQISYLPLSLASKRSSNLDGIVKLSILVLSNLCFE